MWTKSRVRFDFLSPLMAGLPKDESALLDFLEAGKPGTRPPEGRSIEEIKTEVLDTLYEAGEVGPPGEHVFQVWGEEAAKYGGVYDPRSLPDGVPAGALVVRQGTFRAHLKDNARGLSRYYIGRVEGEATFATRLVDTCYYPPQAYWVPILDQTGAYVPEPQIRRRAKAIRVYTPRGPKSAIKLMDGMWAGAAIEWPLWILTSHVRVRRTRTTAEGKEEKYWEHKPAVIEEDLHTVFQFGAVKGYGPERGDGAGRYTYSLKREEDTHAGSE